MNKEKALKLFDGLVVKNHVLLQKKESKQFIFLSLGISALVSWFESLAVWGTTNDSATAVNGHSLPASSKHTTVDSQQDILMLGTKHRKIHLPTTVSELNGNLERGISASRAVHTSVKLLQDLGRASKMITISKLSPYSSHSDQVASARTEKLIV